MPTLTPLSPSPSRVGTNMVITYRAHGGVHGTIDVARRRWETSEQSARSFAIPSTPAIERVIQEASTSDLPIELTIAGVSTKRDRHGETYNWRPVGITFSLHAGGFADVPIWSDLIPTGRVEELVSVMNRVYAPIIARMARRQGITFASTSPTPVAAPVPDVFVDRATENRNRLLASRRLRSQELLAPAVPAVPTTLAQYPSPLGLSEDHSIFQRLYRTAANIENPVSADDISGDFHFRGLTSSRTRTFGLEIEVDFPNSRDFGYERRTLARRLYENALSFDDRVQNWHAAARRFNPDGSVGYTNARNGWSVEFDRTVDDVGGARGCEIVSPVLTSSPQTWTDVAKVLEIVVELGGTMSLRHGLHVNISGEGFGAESMSNLLHMGHKFDDLLVRLAHAPEIGPRHRGRAYCATPTWTEYASTSGLVASNGHMSAINVSHLDLGRRRSSGSRIEFRIFDGTLDLGRIQANVMLCMAMVAAAISGQESDLENEAGGSRVARRGTARRLSGDAWRQDSERVRHFIDFLSLDEESAQHVVTMYRASRWMIA